MIWNQLSFKLKTFQNFRLFHQLEESLKEEKHLGIVSNKKLKVFWNQLSKLKTDKNLYQDPDDDPIQSSIISELQIEFI